MKNSKIEWTTHTFNPWIGCTKVSPGCANCYAETLNNRMKWTQWGPGGRRFRTGAENWNEPIRWNRQAADARAKHVRENTDGSAFQRPRVFCASLADWLDAEVPFQWRVDLLALIEKTPELDWLLLTKRPADLGKRLNECATLGSFLAVRWLSGAAPANVWLGTSAENQKYWDERVPAILGVPAVKRFVSAEPLLGPIVMGPSVPDWLIVGGESGPGARPMSHNWARALRDECKANGAAFFFKQHGGENKKLTGRVLDGETHSEFPTL